MMIPRVGFFTFGVRGILLFTAVVAVGLGMLTSNARKHVEAERWASENSDFFYSVWPPVDDLIPYETTGSPTPAWLRWIGDEYFEKSYYVMFAGSQQVSDLSPLADLNSLHCLDLEFAEVSDLSSLAKLSKLRDLNLGYTQAHDLSPLGNLTGLKRLRILGTPATDLSPLSKLVNLETLFICSAATPEDLDGLRAALPNCAISDRFW